MRMTRATVLFALLGAVGALAGCGGPGPPAPAGQPPPAPPPGSSPSAGLHFTLTSTALADGSAIPKRYTCDGGDRSPELRWKAAPDGTRGFALIVHDPDAPGGDFTH